MARPRKGFCRQRTPRRPPRAHARTRRLLVHGREPSALMKSHRGIAFPNLGTRPSSASNSGCQNRKLLRDPRSGHVEGKRKRGRPVACRATERRSGTKKMPRHRLGHTGARHSLGDARLVRPSHPQRIHAGLQEPYTEARDPETRLCVFCGVPSGPTNKSPAHWRG